MYLKQVILLSWKRQKCQINFSSGQKHKELKENGMKEKPLFALRLSGTCRLCESLTPHMPPLPGQVLPGHGAGRQSPFHKALRDLTNESTKYILSHLQFTDINGRNIWQVTSFLSFTSFPCHAHPNTLKDSPPSESCC